MAGDNQPQQPQSDYTNIQESFSDAFEYHVNPWSAALTFGARATRTGENHEYHTRVRMPLQQAKAMAVLMLRTIRTWEERMGVEVTLPDSVLEELGIPKEDWRRWSQ
ncbi:MAG: hypothetical protein WD533_00435 [Dehalococcoidia bacterium]